MCRAHTSQRHASSIGGVLVAVAGRLHVDLAGGGERGAVAAEAGLHHAVELVDAERDRLDERGRVADTHQVARPIGREVFGRGGSAGSISARVSPTDSPPMP